MLSCLEISFSKPVARYNCATLRYAIFCQQISTFHYPESPYGRTYADVIRTKISRIDSLPNYLSYRAPLKVEPRSTFTFTRGLSYIASISFTGEFYLRSHGKITLTVEINP